LKIIGFAFLCSTVSAIPFLCSTVSAIQRTPTSITAQEILERHIAATGGMEARKALHTLVARGDFGWISTHRDGDYVFSYKAPSSDMLQVQMISHGAVWTGHQDGKLVERSSVGGPAMINGASMNIVERDWFSLLEWDFNQAYQRIELVGLADVDGRRAYALR